MPKISALKLVDEAVIPVVLVIGAKICAIFLVTIVLNYPWTFGRVDDSLSLWFITFSNFNHLIVVSSISDFFAALVAGIGFAWIIYRSEDFGKENLHPKRASHLHRKGLEFLIINTYEAFHQASIWFIVSWLTVFSIFLNSIVGITSVFILGFSVSITLILTYGLREFVRRTRY